MSIIVIMDGNGQQVETVTKAEALRFAEQGLIVRSAKNKNRYLLVSQVVEGEVSGRLTADKTWRRDGRGYAHNHSVCNQWVSTLKLTTT